MGLLDLFDPARKWTRNPHLRLDLDLSRAVLGGAQLGDPAEQLSRFGRPSNRDATRSGVFRWRDDGFQADVDDGRVTCFVVSWGAPDLEGLAPFKGNVFHGGAPIPLGPKFSEENFVRRCGPPARRDDDDEEILLIYNLGQTEWEVEFTKEGLLCVITLMIPSRA